MKAAKRLFVADPSWEGFLGAVLGARTMSTLFGTREDIAFEFAHIRDMSAEMIGRYDFIYVIEGEETADGEPLVLDGYRFIECRGREHRKGFSIRSYVQTNGEKPFSVSVMRTERKTIEHARRFFEKAPEIAARIKGFDTEEERRRGFQEEATHVMALFRRDLQIA